MNDIQKLYNELIKLYPNRTTILDAPTYKETGYWWLDIDRVTVIWKADTNKYEVAACPPGCVSENHAFEYGGDFFFNTIEETLNAVRDLLDNNGYTHKL